MSRRPAATDGVHVGVVITSFDPNGSLVEAFRSVSPQSDAVVVVDDGSSAPAPGVLEACQALGATVRRHDTNLGIGAALNTGVRAVTDALRDVDGPVYVLTLDQDSVVPPGYVDALVATARAAQDAGIRVGMVGPDRAEGIRLAATRSTDGIEHDREPIQSGLLVPVRTFEEIGLFDSELFIDGVDSDFYLRARAQGLAAVVAPGTRLGHRLGREHVVSVLGHRVALVHAADFRYYYIARNRVILLRRHARHAPWWSVRAMLKDFRHLAVTGVLVPGRRARAAETVAGVRDGLRGRTGRRPQQ